MAVEVDKLYLNLDKLLHDICKFLADEANYQKLSPHARLRADELINRSKRQLQEIAKINEFDYVDMERKPVKEDKQEIYTSVEESHEVIRVESNPYSNLAAKDLCIDLKYGILSWKCKTFLKFEKTRRIYSGIHNNWLLIYSSEKDLKPIQTFYLKNYKAEAIFTKQGKNSQHFQLICMEGEKKTYNFLATTHKDMLQWVSHINRCYDKLQKVETTIMLEDDELETYDIISELNNHENFQQDKEEEDIYDNIKDSTFENKFHSAKPPDLPARRFIKPNIPLPRVPSPEPEELDNYSRNSHVSLESSSSFSSDDEDNTYDEFVQPVEKKNSFNNTQTTKVVISDTYLKNALAKLGKPKPPLKHNILTKKQTK